MSYKEVLSIDFDGVLHLYTSGWKGADVIPDPPVPGAMAFVAEAVKHFDVAIYSSRSHQPGGREAMETWMTYWLDESFGYYVSRGIMARLSFPDFKPSAFVSLDDRALRFEGEWPDLEKMKALKPWNDHLKIKS